MTETEQITEKVEFKFYKGSNYLALPRDPQPWIIEKLIPVGLTNLVGRPKQGKSYLALQIAAAVSNPNVETFLERTIVKHGLVMYLQVDTPREEWAQRAEKFKSNGLDIEGIAFTDANLVPYPVNLTNQPIQEALREVIVQEKPTLFIVDTLREVHEGDENQSLDMKKIITALVKVTKDVGTSLLLVSHTRKDTVQYNGDTGGDEDNDLMDSGRGSGYTSGRMDMVMKLTNKNLLLKGRSVGKTKIGVEQNHLGLVVLNAEKAENEANIKFVCAQANLTTDRQRAEMLAAMENIELEAARSRIRSYKKKAVIQGE